MTVHKSYLSGTGETAMSGSSGHINEWQVITEMHLKVTSENEGLMTDVCACASAMVSLHM